MNHWTHETMLLSHIPWKQFILWLKWHTWWHRTHTYSGKPSRRGLYEYEQIFKVAETTLKVMANRINCFQRKKFDKKMFFSGRRKFYNFAIVCCLQLACKVWLLTLVSLCMIKVQSPPRISWITSSWGGGSLFLHMLTSTQVTFLRKDRGICGLMKLSKGCTTPSLMQ